MLDPLRATSYIAAGAWMIACGAHPASLVPEPLSAAAAESVAEWTMLHGPTRPTTWRFKWRYRDDQVAGGGRVTARVAPPDSVRVDWATTFNIKTGAAVVIGDSLVWADPKRDFPATPLPAVQLIWTALGVMRLPGAATAVYGAHDSTQTVWRYVTGSDTVDFRLRHGDGPLTLESEWRRDAQVKARGHTVLGPTGQPQNVRIDVPERPARFELTFVAMDTTAAFPPALWRGRR